MCLVTELLAADWTSPWTKGHNWAPWHLEHASRARMEIKQSSAREPWNVGQNVQTRSIWFNIAVPELYWTLDRDLIAPPGRLAEIYIFAWHGEAREVIADHRAPEQWNFFVVPTKSLRPKQQSFGLLDLEALTEAVGYEALVGAVREILDGCHRRSESVGN